MGKRRIRRLGAPEGNKSDKEEEASTVPIAIKMMEDLREKMQ